MKNRLDEMIEEYKVAVRDNDETKMKEIEDFFKEHGIEPLGLQVMAFA